MPPRQPSPMRRRVRNLIRRLSSDSSRNATDHSDSEDPFADPADPFADTPSIADRVEAELIIFTQAVDAMHARPDYMRMPVGDRGAERSLRKDLLKRGSKSKRRMGKLLREGAVPRELHERIDVQRERFRVVKTAFMLPELQMMGLL